MLGGALAAPRGVIADRGVERGFALRRAGESFAVRAERRERVRGIGECGLRQRAEAVGEGLGRLPVTGGLLRTLRGLRFERGAAVAGGRERVARGRLRRACGVELSAGVVERALCCVEPRLRGGVRLRRGRDVLDAAVEPGFVLGKRRRCALALGDGRAALAVSAVESLLAALRARDDLVVALARGGAGGASR